MREVKAFFQEKFGAVPRHLVQAPGRLELLGNHTDYNEGLVMSLAVDKYIFIASSPRSDGQIELVSTAFPERERFYHDKIEKNPAARWADYVKGVLLQLRERGVHFTGFNAAIHGTIPFGAGLSSSAALEIASALTVRRLFPFKILGNGIAPAPERDRHGELPPLGKDERMALAKIGQAAESRFVGVNCGLLDQISSLFGREGQVIEIDCRGNSVGHRPMAPGVTIVVCDSGVKHELSGGEYNELRAHCESAARTLGVKALRDIDPKNLAANRSKLAERDWQCAYHIVGENQRVIFGERALREGDIAQFGQYLFQSHASSRDFFRNSAPELDLLVELAGQHPGCLGARLTGGGFGGATINLVWHDQVESFQKHMRDQYRARSGRETHPWPASIVDGAR